MRLVTRRFIPFDTYPGLLTLVNIYRRTSPFPVPSLRRRRPHVRCSRRLCMMTTDAVTSRGQAAETVLDKAMERLGLSPSPCLPNTYPRFNALDIYRSHLAQLLGPITGVDPSAILPFLHWTQTLDKGDLTLPVPALKIKGRKPDETVKSITDQVSYSRLHQPVELRLI